MDAALVVFVRAVDPGVKDVDVCAVALAENLIVLAVEWEIELVNAVETPWGDVVGLHDTVLFDVVNGIQLAKLWGDNDRDGKKIKVNHL